MTWNPDDLRDALNKAHELQLHVVSFDTGEETLTIRLTNKPSEPPPPAWENEAKQMVRDGKKISAIKHVRENTRLSLADAKDLVESW